MNSGARTAVWLRVWCPPGFGIRKKKKYAKQLQRIEPALYHVEETFKSKGSGGCKLEPKTTNIWSRNQRRKQEGDDSVACYTRDSLHASNANTIEISHSTSPRLSTSCHVQSRPRNWCPKCPIKLLPTI